MLRNNWQLVYQGDSHLIRREMGCNEFRLARMSIFLYALDRVNWWVIDALVYELYGLSPEEIKIVEGKE